MFYLLRAKNIALLTLDICSGDIENKNNFKHDSKPWRLFY